MLAPNFSSGLQNIGFAATGTVVTISATSGQSTSSGITWDFLIDNINFNTTSTPEPASAFFIAIGLVALGLVACQANNGTVGGSPDSTSATCSIIIAGAPVITTSARTQKWPEAVRSPQFATVTVSTSGLTSNPATFSVEEIWEQITDQYAVTYDQVNPLFPGSVVSDWQTGMAFANYNQLSLEGMTDGYIQVLEFDSPEPQNDGAWVVQNLPVENSKLAQQYNVHLRPHGDGSAHRDTGRGLPHQLSRGASQAACTAAGNSARNACKAI